VEVHPKHAEPGKLWNDFGGERATLVVLRDQRKKPVVDEATDGPADESLLLAQQVIDAIKIHEGRQSDLIV